MYEIDDEAVARAGERGAALGGQIRNRRAYRSGGIAAVADAAGRVGDMEAMDTARTMQRQDIALKNNQRQADDTHTRTQQQNWEQFAPYAVNIIRGSREFDPARRRAVLEQNAQRFRAAGFSDAEIQAGIAGLTDADPAVRQQWEQELITSFTQAPEAQVSEQTGDIYTINPATMAPETHGQVPGADLMRRGAEADVANTERDAREPYRRGGGDGDVTFASAAAERQRYQSRMRDLQDTRLAADTSSGYAEAVVAGNGTPRGVDRRTLRTNDGVLLMTVARMAQGAGVLSDQDMDVVRGTGIDASIQGAYGFISGGNALSERQRFALSQILISRRGALNAAMQQHHDESLAFAQAQGVDPAMLGYTEPQQSPAPPETPPIPGLTRDPATGVWRRPRGAAPTRLPPTNPGQR